MSFLDLVGREYNAKETSMCCDAKSFSHQHFKKSENSCDLFGEKTQKKMQEKNSGSDKRNKTSDRFKRISRVCV